MKSGRSIQDVSREILRQQEAKADYLVATDRLHMDTWGDSPVIRVLNREGIDQIEPLEIQQTAHQQIGTYLDIPSKYYDRMLQRDPALLLLRSNRTEGCQSGQCSLRCRQMKMAFRFPTLL